MPRIRRHEGEMRGLALDPARDRGRRVGRGRYASMERSPASPDLPWPDLRAKRQGCGRACPGSRVHFSGHAWPSSCVFESVVRRFPIILLGACLSGPAFAQDSRRIVDEKSLIDVDQQVRDVLVVDGGLEVRGLVRGHLFALGSEVVVRSSAVILGSATAVGGSFRLEDGAVLPANVSLRDCDFRGPRGQTLEAGGSMKVAAGSTTVTMGSTSSSTTSDALTRAVLPFERYVPSATVAVQALDVWSPGLGLTLADKPDDSKGLVIGGRVQLRPVTDRVRGTLQKRFRGLRGQVLLTAVKLDSVASAEELWAQIIATPFEEKARISIKSGLLDGNHWFFRSGGHYTMAWQRGPWLLAVETRLGHRGATILQQQQFNRQILESFRQSMPGRDAQELER